MKLARLHLAFWLAIPLLAAPYISAQSTTGSVSGRVVDATGAVIPEAQISITNVEKGLVTQVSSNGIGEYNALALPPGRYTMTINHQGFSTRTVAEFTLDIDQQAHLDVTLTVTKAAETVTVTEAEPLLQVQGSETGSVIGTKEILDLPLEGRQYQNLFALTPGVTSGGGYGSENFSISGQREEGNDIELNGIDIQGNRNNDNSLQPSVDALQEFKILTSAYAPEFGRASGGVVLLQTKAGTNNYHGDVYEFFRPNNTAANSAISPPGSEPILKQHNFGATFGGPIMHNKAFFFASYEGTRVINHASYYDIVPPSQQINYLADGDVDLSQLTDPYTGTQDPIFDPYFFENNYYASQFPNNLIPAADVSAGGKMILQQLFPAAENGNFYGNYYATQQENSSGNVGNIRFDYTFSQKDRAYLTYDIEQSNFLSGDPFAGHIPIAGGGGADSGVSEYAESDTVGLIYDHIFTTNLLNEVHGSYYMTPYHSNSLVDGTNLATKFGIMNANIPGFPQTYGFPQIQFESGDTTGGSTYEPLDFRDHNIQFVDQLSWVKGRHTMKFGYEYRLLQSTPDFSLFPVPYEYFGGPYVALTSDPTYTYYNPYAYYANGGSEVADLLLGLPLDVFQGLQVTIAHTRANEHSFYLQDYWQATPHLNITYGVRYEYQQPYVEQNNNAANFDPATLSMNIAGRGGNSRSLVNSNMKNFSPRVGFAYELDSKTSIHGGYGIFFSPENDAKEDLLTKNYPFFFQEGFSNSPYYLSYFLDQGVARPTSVSIPSGASSVPLTSGGGVGQNVYYETPNLPTGYSESYNLTVQRMITPQTSFELGYVGAVSKKLSYAIGNINNKNALSSSIGQVDALTDQGLGNYNSMQVSVKKQVSAGVGLRLSYTFAKTMDNGPGPFNIGAGSYPQNPNDLHAEYAVANYDRRNSFVGAGTFELPVGHGRWLLPNANKAEQFVLGGWELATITTLQTGTPINVVLPTPSNSGTTPRPDLCIPSSGKCKTGSNPNSGPKTTSEWFNTGAFVPQVSTDHGIGDAPRNSVRGPGYTNADISLLKDFALPRKATFQLRFEAFNALNIAHYNAPGATFGNGNFGKITGGFNPRVMQFAGKINF